MFQKVPYNEEVGTFLDSSSQSEVDEFVKSKLELMSKLYVDFANPESSACLDDFAFLMLRKVIIVHLTKQLLQLLTPEALVIHSEKINTYYKQCYLDYQHHFSLASIIRSERYRLTEGEVKKFLCYTRTSPAILELIPTQFSNYSFSSVLQEDRETIKRFFQIDPPSLLCTYTITNSTSQKKLNDFLKTFFSSPQRQVLLMLADMNKLHKGTINHTRLLIEEAERTELSRTKMVVLVLHFPTNMFYRHCYPSIFLRGWQHIYMDMVGRARKDFNTDVEKWLRVCLLQSDDESEINTQSFVDDTTMTAWIREWLPMISKSITINPSNDFPANKKIKECWDSLLFRFGAGDVIKERFNTFWQHSTMYELSLQAANYAMTYQSTCTLSCTIETIIQSSFKNVVLYFLSIISNNMAIHTLLGRCQNTEKPFRKILKIFPIPKSLQQIKLELSALNFQKIPAGNKAVTSPHFPFFPFTFDVIEGIVNNALSSGTEPVKIATENYNDESIRLGGVTANNEEYETTVQRIAQFLQVSYRIIFAGASENI